MPGISIKLIIEDGNLPEGANTYVDLDAANAYVASRGPAVSGLAAWTAADAETKSAALIRAADVLNSYHWRGLAAAPGRIMAWPRRQVNLPQSGPGGSIPPQLVAAQCELAAAILAEGDPLSPVDPRLGPITSAKLDTLAVSYAAPASGGAGAASPAGHPAVAALLRGFLLDDPFGSGGRGGIGLTEVGRG
ncbi:MAG: hypothetical protein LBV80_10970 [Deltaproteobacteria bacterium]|jgi:hypothetical protein|nr:hypothetical protein [Deltaproteobacteria bacterium]